MTGQERRRSGMYKFTNLPPVGPVTEHPRRPQVPPLGDLRRPQLRDAAEVGRILVDGIAALIDSEGLEQHVAETTVARLRRYLIEVRA